MSEEPCPVGHVDHVLDELVGDRHVELLNVHIVVSPSDLTVMLTMCLICYVY